MAVKDGWEHQISMPSGLRLPPGAQTVIDRAARLGREEVDLLDLAEHVQSGFRLVAWDVLRSRLQGGDVAAMRLSARNRAWAAVNQSLRAMDVDSLPGDDYWRVTTGLGWGAARAARFAACALVAPDLLEPEVAEMLLRPWLVLRPEPEPSGLA
jgi:hypothetical protein